MTTEHDILPAVLFSRQGKDGPFFKTVTDANYFDGRQFLIDLSSWTRPGKGAFDIKIESTRGPVKSAVLQSCGKTIATINDDGVNFPRESPLLVWKANNAQLTLIVELPEFSPSWAHYTTLGYSKDVDIVTVTASERDAVPHASTPDTFTFGSGQYRFTYDMKVGSIVNISL